MVNNTQNKIKWVFLKPVPYKEPISIKLFIKWFNVIYLIILEILERNKNMPNLKVKGNSSKR
jgi:hypothetical protein